MTDFGLTKDEFSLLKSLVVAPLTKRGATVWCFGSRAKGTHSEFSDIDLMVESQDDLSELIAEVKEAIVDSTFPYKVDIVDWKHFAYEYKVNFEKEKTLISLTHDDKVSP